MKIKFTCFDYSAIIDGITNEVTNGFPYMSGEKNLFEDVLNPNSLDIEKYRLRNDMKENILKK